MTQDAVAIDAVSRWFSRERLHAALRRAAPALRDAALAERERWALWIPALLGCGIGFYFMLAVEPPGWSGPALICAAGLAILLGRRHAALLLPGIAALIVACGFADAQLQTWLLAPPALERPLRPVRVEGGVGRGDPRPARHRLLVHPPAIPRAAARPLPPRPGLPL